MANFSDGDYTLKTNEILTDARGKQARLPPEKTKIKKRAVYIRPGSPNTYTTKRKGRIKAVEYSYRHKGKTHRFVGALTVKTYETWKNKEGKKIPASEAYKHYNIHHMQAKGKKPTAAGWVSLKRHDMRKTRHAGKLFTTLRYTVKIRGYIRKKEYKDEYSGKVYAQGTMADDFEFYRARTYDSLSTSNVYRLMRDNEPAIKKDILASKRKEGLVFPADTDIEISRVDAADTYS